MRKIIFHCLLLFFGIGFFAGIYIFILSRDLPSLERLENFDPDLVTRIYSSDEVVLHELFYQKRVFAELRDIPEHMRQATIISEDRRFKEHWGISLRSVARAIVVNVLSLSYRQGFSTLSQQLARNLYKSIGFEDNITRKLKEVITAIQIERTYTKDEILEMYLNTVHFGHGTYGVESSAKRFFGKTSSDLTLDESALLVGLLPSPANYSPIRYPKKALARRNIVLKLMFDHKFIDIEDYNYTMNKGLESIIDEPLPGKAPYFTEYIRRSLEKIDDELEFNIYRDGLKVYTTLDSKLQEIAEEVVMKSVKRNQEILNRRLFNDDEKFSKLGYFGIYPEDSVRLMMQGEAELYKELREQLLVQVAFVALDPKTGSILAMVGGRPDYHDQFNRAVQAARQPGSVFKPFVYATAIDNDYPVTTQLLNQPVVLNVQNANGEWEKWMPRNYDESTGGLTTLREGLRRSLNLISVRLVQELVPAREVKNTAKRLGISTDIRAVDAIALGTSEVIPLDIISAYGVFASGGIYSHPLAITRIEDRYGNVIKKFSSVQEEVLRPSTSYMMTNLMKTVVDAGTGGSARWKYKFYAPAAGKTGTTQGYSDAWFVGFTPHLVAGVWFGIDDYSVSLGKMQDGSRAALPVWARFMREAYKTLELKNTDFKRPDDVKTVEICSVSKKQSLGPCPVEKEIFIEGTQPVDKCRVHKPL
ncbi:MAG: PBP1A family penicillin-binding protein [Candidatus Neomarinimicrobiota bacterium]|nr:PBP1A family penicillin-binding protein [Candidatus Neomarinimicrobiota bacterium]